MSVFLRVCASLIGGAQEKGRRAGTENVVLISAMGAASKIAYEEIIQSLLHMLALKLRLITALKQNLSVLGSDALIFNGPSRGCDEKELTSDISLLRVIFNKTTPNDAAKELLVEQLPNTVSVSFKDVSSGDLMPLLANTVR
jgi:hypothetical protein